MDYSAESPKPDQSPSDTPGLSPEAAAALGVVSPELAWLQLRGQVIRAIDDQEQEALQIAEAAEWPASMDAITVRMSKYPPAEALTLFQEANPMFDLEDIPQGNPLVALEAVLHMILNVQ